MKTVANYALSASHLGTHRIVNFFFPVKKEQLELSITDKHQPDLPMTAASASRIEVNPDTIMPRN